MSVQAMTWAFAQELPPAPKFVLVALANYANADASCCRCFPGQKTLARDTCLGERTVRRSLKYLERHGFIERMRRRRADGTRTSDEVALMLKRTLWPVDELPATVTEPTGHCGRAINRKRNRQLKATSTEVVIEGQDDLDREFAWCDR
jgi:DNA-binding transcriptional MocR family regulator